MSADAPATARMGTWAIRLLAALGVVGSIAFIVIAVVIVSFTVHRDHQAAPVAAADNRETYTVDAVSYIHGTMLMRLDIAVSDAERGSFKSIAQGPRNIVLLDRTTGTSRRLLPNNDRAIVDTKMLPEEDNTPARYYYLLVARSDGKGSDVIIGDLHQPRQATVMTALDGVDSIGMADANHVEMVLRDHQKLSYRIIDLTALKVTATHPIAID